jgi:hypothetical protein
MGIGSRRQVPLSPAISVRVRHDNHTESVAARVLGLSGVTVEERPFMAAKANPFLKASFSSAGSEDPAF